MRSFAGIVQKGARRGHALGYPTINIPMTDPEISGVYIARVYLAGEAPYMAAAFADPRRGILEAHIIDFSDELYGENVRIGLRHKIRETETFDSDDELRNAIAEDIAAVRKFFSL